MWSACSRSIWMPRMRSKSDGFSTFHTGILVASWTRSR